MFLFAGKTPGKTSPLPSILRSAFFGSEDIYIHKDYSSKTLHREFFMKVSGGLGCFHATHQNAHTNTCDRTMQNQVHKSNLVTDCLRSFDIKPLSQSPYNQGLVLCSRKRERKRVREKEWDRETEWTVTNTSRYHACKNGTVLSYMTKA